MPSALFTSRAQSTLCRRIGLVLGFESTRMSKNHSSSDSFDTKRDSSDSLDTKRDSSDSFDTKGDELGKMKCWEITYGESNADCFWRFVEGTCSPIACVEDYNNFA